MGSDREYAGIIIMNGCGCITEDIQESENIQHVNGVWYHIQSEEVLNLVGQYPRTDQVALYSDTLFLEFSR